MAPTMDCSRVHFRRLCEHFIFVALACVSLSLIIITGAALQFTDTGSSDAAWAKLQAVIASSINGKRTVGPCLLGIVGGFNACNYAYAVGAFGLLLAVVCFMHHESYFSPEPPLGLLSAKAYAAAFGVLWFVTAGIVIGVLNDERFNAGDKCVACSMARPEQRTAIWALCFTASGMCVLLVAAFALEHWLGASAPPLLAAVQGRLFTYGTRDQSYRSQSNTDPATAAAANAAALATAEANSRAYAKSRLGPMLEKAEAAGTTHLDHEDAPAAANGGLIGTTVPLDHDEPAPAPAPAAAAAAATDGATPL